MHEQVAYAIDHCDVWHDAAERFAQFLRDHGKISPAAGFHWIAENCREPFFDGEYFWWIEFGSESFSHLQHAEPEFFSGVLSKPWLEPQKSKSDAVFLLAEFIGRYYSFPN